MLIKKMQVNGYAEKSIGNAENGKSWYIPHHGLHHSNKPRNCRIVFDCGDEYEYE